MKTEHTRKDWMSLLAKAPAQALDQLWTALDLPQNFTWLRAPEVGGVMVQGRTGGTGARFNLGEMTVTRCTLQLASGPVGHAYVQGRDKRKAEQAALVDALMQSPLADKLRADLLTPLQDTLDTARATRAARAATTKVDFFTLARGEDT